MGVSGGIVPCPEALGVLLVAAGSNRTALGVVVVGAFSVGLAAVLVALGLMLVLARAHLPRPRFGRGAPGAGRARRLVPFVSAGVVSLFGIAMALRGAGALVG